jgi:hypothetical protein
MEAHMEVQRMASTTGTVDSVLEPLWQGFQADGANLAVDGAFDAEIQVRLVVTDETCLDCILLTAAPTRVVEQAVRERLPEAGRITSTDPRA